MSNRRAATTRFSSTNDEVNDLILKLQALLPNSTSRCNNHNTRVSAAKIVEETSRYIKKLEREADDLSERLSKLLASGEITAIDAHILSSLLKQYS
ncbi:hypothetical protein ABFX02_09G036700 [Erythranthe guttata]